MLAADFKIPRIHTHLVKRIPSQAGMGGGSADAAYMIRLLDERFRLNIGIPEMERYAAKLGADCAYFISADPENGDTACYAEGIGDVLMPASGPGDNMKGYYIVVVKRDDIAVSTKDAYAARSLRNAAAISSASLSRRGRMSLSTISRRRSLRCIQSWQKSSRSSTIWGPHMQL